MSIFKRKEIIKEIKVPILSKEVKLLKPKEGEVVVVTLNRIGKDYDWEVFIKDILKELKEEWPNNSSFVILSGEMEVLPSKEEAQVRIEQIETSKIVYEI